MTINRLETGGLLLLFDLFYLVVKWQPIHWKRDRWLRVHVFDFCCSNYQRPVQDIHCREIAIGLWWWVLVVKWRVAGAIGSRSWE